MCEVISQFIDKNGHSTFVRVFTSIIVAEARTRTNIGLFPCSMHGKITIVHKREMETLFQ